MHSIFCSGIDLPPCRNFIKIFELKTNQILWFFLFSFLFIYLLLSFFDPESTILFKDQLGKQGGAFISVVCSRLKFLGAFHGFIQTHVPTSLETDSRIPSSHSISFMVSRILVICIQPRHLFKHLNVYPSRPAIMRSIIYIYSWLICYRDCSK